MAPARRASARARVRRAAVTTAGIALLLAAPACGPRRLALPADPGAPLTSLQAMHDDVVRACRAVRTFTAELSLAGRAGGERLRGRVLAGFAAPDSMRLEGVAPFGPPAFILAASGSRALLLLPRERRVVRADHPGELLGALTGVSLAPADLRAVLTGCVVPDPRPLAGRLHGNGWASIDLAGGARAYLVRVSGGWQLRAASRDGWQVEYTAWQGGYPRVVALRSTGDSAAVDLTATVAQLEANVDIDAAAFTIDVPAEATPLSLDDLRANGPLRDRP